MRHLTIKVAGIPIGIDYRNRYLLDYYQAYLTQEQPDFTVCATNAELLQEYALVHRSWAEIESVCVYRKIAQQLPSYGAFVFHAAVITLDGNAFAFTAASGTGKTTHIRHLLSRYGERASVLNGDKPIVRIVDGTVLVCGTPWQGKEKLGSNTTAPLRGICFLARAQDNQMSPVSGVDAAPLFLKQIYMPQDAQMLQQTLTLADRVLNSVALYRLHCNPDPVSADLSGSILTQSAAK